MTDEPVVMPREERRGVALGKRAVWIIGDQALASLANAGLTIGLARVVSTTEYGAFALAFSVYSFVQSLSQAMTGQVLIVRYSAAGPDLRRRAAGAGAASSLIVGAIAGVLVIAIAFFTGMPVQATLIAAGIVLPALMLQDFWRTTFVAFGTPSRAFFNDLIWILLWASLFALLFWVGEQSSGVYLAAWGASALIAAAIASRQSRTLPNFGGAKVWLLGHREVSVPSLAHAFAILGAIQLAFVLIAALGAVEDVGSLRAAQTLLGPLNIVGFAVSSFTVPELVRRNFGRKGLYLSAVGVSGLLVLAAVVWGGILLLLPDAAGETLLSDTWAGARTTLPGLLIYTIDIAATTGATMVMRALNRVQTAFWVSVMLGPLVLICSVIGVELGGAEGAAYGFAIAGAVVIIPCWFLLVRDVRRGRREVASVL